MARIEKWDEVHGTQAPDERMMAFLDSTTDQYAILQLRRSEDTVYERFSSMRELERMGLEPDIDHYEVVYLRLKKSGFSMWNFGTRIPCIRSSARKARKIWQEFWGMRKMFTCTIWWLI